MKPRKSSRNSSRHLLAAIVAITALVAASIGVSTAYARLRKVWLGPCKVTDVVSQVSIYAGKMVKDDAIKEAFGLREGVNLALIDFASKRLEVLGKYPTIREINITRHLPDHVNISIIEREPTARVGLVGMKQDTGRVTDTQGVVFPCRRGTGTLPVIREATKPGTPIGKRLQGRAIAALRLIEFSRDPAFADIGVLEVDISKPDHLIATLGNYDRAKIAWEGMDDPSDPHLKALSTLLRQLAGAVRCASQSGSKHWDATIANQISCDEIRGIN